MFIVSLTYTCDLEKVDELLDEHIAFLKNQYAKGSFIASGRKVPRTGGIILARVESREALEEIIKGDPFHKNSIADYEINEFVPTMAGDGFENILE
jgi:uncharacterized protein YciI